MLWCLCILLPTYKLLLGFLSTHVWIIVFANDYNFSSKYIFAQCEHYQRWSHAGVSPTVSNLLCVLGQSFCHITRQILKAVIIMNPFVSGYSEYWTCQRLLLPPPLHGSTALVGLGLLNVEVARSHSEDTTHSVGLLLSSDRPVAETSTWKQSQTTGMHARGGIRTWIPASERPKTYLDRAATGTGQRNITDYITGIIQAYTHFTKPNKFHGSKLQL